MTPARPIITKHLDPAALEELIEKCRQNVTYLESVLKWADEASKSANPDVFVAALCASRARAEIGLALMHFKKSRKKARNYRRG